MDRSEPAYVEAVRYLYDRINYEKTIDRPYDQQNYRLARMEFLLEKLGNPQRSAPVIHIAGTKGKGSVAWLLSEAMRIAGYKVGIYTSPHLCDLEERFVIDGIPIAPFDLVQSVHEIRSAVEETSSSHHGSPTFFEITTALGWINFHRAKTDINVIEVGLGGRLDSTNVCNSLLSIITSISFDHQAQLGNTIAKIAREKAGIIKPGTFVIHGAKHPDAREVIREVSRTQCCDLWELGRDFDSMIEFQPSPIDDTCLLPKQIDPTELTPSPMRANPIAENSAQSKLKGSLPKRQVMTFIPSQTRPELTRWENLPLRMLGKHQSDNAALVIAAGQKLNSLGFDISETAIRKSLECTQVSCRIEQVASSPTVIVDSAHNVASIGSLVETLTQIFTPRKKTIVFASSKDKEYESMLELLISYSDRLIVTQYANNPRFVQVERLEELAKGIAVRYGGKEILSAPSSEIASEFALSHAAPNDLICFTGSFFLASEIKPRFI